MNLVLGIVIYFCGQEVFSNVLSGHRYITPLFATLIGLIPNCASSVILAELYIGGAISFGSILAGLSANAGLGLVILLKGNEKRSVK